MAQALFELGSEEIDYSGQRFLDATSPAIHGTTMRPFIEAHPDIVPLLRLVLQLTDADLRNLSVDGSVRKIDRDGDGISAGLVEGEIKVSMGMDPSPESTQQLITSAAD